MRRIIAGFTDAGGGTGAARACGAECEGGGATATFSVRLGSHRNATARAAATARPAHRQPAPERRGRLGN